MTRAPCRDCPFRRRTFTKLADSESVEAMIEHVRMPASFMYCHKDIDEKNVECTGSVLFRDNDQSGVVFVDDQALRRAHRESKKMPYYHWGFYDWGDG